MTHEEIKNLVLNTAKDIEKNKSKLVEVERPENIPSASILVDDQIKKLDWNIRVFVSLERFASQCSIELKADISRKTLECVTDLNDKKLSELAINRNQKFKFIESLLWFEYAEYEKMDAEKRYYRNMREVFTQWITDYKKMRDITETGGVGL